MSFEYFTKNLFRLRSFQFIIFLSLIGCLTPLELPVDIAGGRLIVSGQISTLSDQNIIELGTTANIQRLPFPVSDASITLFDTNGGSFSYLEDADKPGVYMLPEFAGVPGRTYHIEVLLANQNVYRSAPQKMPASTPSDVVYYEIVKEDIVDAEGAYLTRDFFKVYSNSSISSTHDKFIKWSVQEGFLLSPTDFPDPFGFIPPPCFVVQNADPQRIALFDESTVTASTITGQLVAARLIDWSFNEKHYFTTYKSSITKESFDYWRKVNVLANQVGSIFDTPPAEITGNIINANNPSEKVLGFFQASNDSYARFFIHSTDLPFPLLNSKCDFDGDYNPEHYPFRCIDCTSVRNSSLKRPDWF